MILLELNQMTVSNISMNMSMYLPKKIHLTYSQQQDLLSEEDFDNHICIYSKDVYSDSLYEFYMKMVALEKVISPMFYTNIDQVFGDVTFTYYGKLVTLPYIYFMKFIRRQYAKEECFVSIY